MSTIQPFSVICQHQRFIQGKARRATLLCLPLILGACILALTACSHNSKPIANAGPDLTVQVNTLVHLDGRASKDPDGDPLTYAWSLQTIPVGSTSGLSDPTAAEPTFTADLPGSYLVQLIVSDRKKSSAPDTATIKVEPFVPANRPPTITSASASQATVDQSYSYDVEATDPDGDTLVYSLVAGPPNMAINSSSGVITWTPTAAQAGIQPAAVKVQDGKGGSATQNFTVTVQAPQNKLLVPNVVGSNKSAAQTQIQQAKLKLGGYTYKHSNTYPDGQVINQNPAANTSVDIGAAINLTVSIGPDNGLPPNPTTVRPEIDPTVATTTYAATQFLYTGSNPIQTGVAEGTIEPKRAAVIRGKVLDKQNKPLPGVTITILNHQELGQTLSRADGQFDLAVNGGGLLNVDYRKDGYLAAQRQVHVPWQDYAFTPDVVLIPVDNQVTTIDLNSSTPMQMARGSVQTDAAGTRQATLLFPKGTQAHMVMPNGSTQQITTLHIRATEFTVGPNGPETMPQELPPTIGYTYATVFTADEAKAAGAKDVVFAQQIPFYVENFLKFKVGVPVPLGAYDSDKGQWIASDSGVVIKIIDITGGLAELDTDGDGIVDNGTSLKVTEAERQQLAGLYTTGQTLWRMLIPHLDKPWDANQGTRCKDNKCEPPNPPEKPDLRTPEVPNPDCQGGSVIECQNQVLAESMRVTARLSGFTTEATGYPVSNTLALKYLFPATSCLRDSKASSLTCAWRDNVMCKISRPPRPI